MPKPKIVTMPASSLTVSNTVQPRASIDDATVERYAEDMAGGAIFPPVVAFGDDEKLWLADGFHRYHARCKDAGSKKDAAIDVEIRAGDKRAAILYAVKCNADHGKPRTHADKRRCVELLLKDMAWATWSSRKIAAEAMVSAPFVESVRQKLEQEGKIKPVKKRTVEQGKARGTGTVKYKVEAPKRKVVVTADDVQGPAVDDLGNEIADEKVAQVFGQRHRITDLITDLRSVKRKVKELADHAVGEFLKPKQVQIDVENAIRGLKCAIPYCTTPPALAEQNPDHAKIGWLPKDQYDLLPTEQKHGEPVDKPAVEPF